MAFEYDLTYNDFNPTVFYVSKCKMTKNGVYHDHDYADLPISYQVKANTL